MFCSNCGKELASPAAKFCNKCGAVQAPPVSRAPAPGSIQEHQTEPKLLPDELLALLFKAVELGDTDRLTELISQGAGVNDTDDTGASALMYASGMGHSGCVERLVSLGADVNARTGDGVTALITAAGRPSPQCVNALIAAGANVNARADLGYTELMAAATTGFADCVSALIAAGADVNARTSGGYTTYCTSAFGRIFHVNVIGRTSGGYTALMAAARALIGSAESVSALIAARADVGASDDDGYTALKWASREGNVDSVKILKPLTKSSGWKLW